MDNSIPDFERKYEDSPEPDFPTWIISSDGNCDFQGRVPRSGENIRINLLEEKSHLPRAGNFCAQEENGEIILFEMVEEGRHKILFRWGPKDVDDVWDRYFQDHENVGLLDGMIRSWKENEEYIELNFNDRTSGSIRTRNSREIRRIVTRKRICAVKDKFYVAKGPIQGCKSQYMIDGALKCLRNGKSSIIIFQETGHLIQFKERLEQEFNLISTKIRESGKQCVPLVCVVVKNENFSPDEFLKSLQGHPAKIFLIIGNDNQAGLLNEKFKKASKLAKSEIIESYVLWVDEADHVDSGTKAKKTWSLSALKKYAYAIVEVSATVLDITAREDVKKEHLSVLRAPRSYRGIPSFTIIETEEKAKYASKVSSNLLRTDKALKRIIDEFVNEIPIRCPAQNDRHPCIMLINNGRTIEPQKRLMMDLKRKYDDLALIVYIGEGIFIHHVSLPKTSFEISKAKSSLTNYGHLFKGVSPSSALLWLKQNGGVQSFHHILIISGNLAGRSISYGCKDPGAEGLKYWHLTHHRLILPKNSSCPEVIQKCRLCTIFETPVPLKLYVNKKDELAVIKSHWSQEEIIERSRANPDEAYLKEIMSRLELLGGRSGKIPVGRTLTINGKLKVCKRVKGDDGGLLMSAYKFDGLSDRERDSFSEKMRKSEVERKDADRNDMEQSITMEISNLEKNVRTALDHNNDTIVLRILRHFKNLDVDAIISLQMLQALGATNISHYTQWTRDGTSKGQYKLLINHHAGYGLNPQVQHLLAIV